jgi:hypothetical protein
MTHDPVEGARVQGPAPTGAAAEGYEAPELIVLGSAQELTAGERNGAGPSQPL